MKKEQEIISPVENAAIKVTKWIGTPASIIVHTILFIAAFSMTKFGYSLDSMLLMLTTIVSLEAIYLGLFVQMTVNRQERRLVEAHEDIQDISEDIDDIQKDVDEISEDVDELTEDVEELGKDVDEISDDIEEMAEDVGELSEETEEEEKEEEAEAAALNQKLQKMEDVLQLLLKQIEELKTK